MRELSDPLTEEDKAWMKSRNMEIPEDTEETDDAGDDIPEPDEDAEYPDWTIPQLKKELAARKLPVSGSKPDLVGRLEADDAANPE